MPVQCPVIYGPGFSVSPSRSDAVYAFLDSFTDMILALNLTCILYVSQMHVSHLVLYLINIDLP